MSNPIFSLFAFLIPSLGDSLECLLFDAISEPILSPQSTTKGRHGSNQELDQNRILESSYYRAFRS